MKLLPTPVIQSLNYDISISVASTLLNAMSKNRKKIIQKLQNLYFGCSFSGKHWKMLPQKTAESSLEICKTP